MPKVLFIWDYKCANFHCLILIFWFLKNSWPLKFGFWPFHATLTFSAKSFKIWSFHVIWRKPLHVRTWFAQKKHKSLHPSDQPGILISTLSHCDLFRMIWSRPMPLGWYFAEQWRRFIGNNWVEQQCDKFIIQDRFLKNFANELPVVSFFVLFFTIKQETYLTTLYVYK